MSVFYDATPQGAALRRCLRAHRVSEACTGSLCSYRESEDVTERVRQIWWRTASSGAYNRGCAAALAERLHAVADWEGVVCAKYRRIFDSFVAFVAVLLSATDGPAASADSMFAQFGSAYLGALRTEVEHGPSYRLFRDVEGHIDAFRAADHVAALRGAPGMCAVVSAVKWIPSTRALAPDPVRHARLLLVPCLREARRREAERPAQLGTAIAALMRRPGMVRDVVLFNVLPFVLGVE